MLDVQLLSCRMNISSLDTTQIQIIKHRIIEDKSYKGGKMKTGKSFLLYNSLYEKNSTYILLHCYLAIYFQAYQGKQAGLTLPKYLGS